MEVTALEVMAKAHAEGEGLQSLSTRDLVVLPNESYRTVTRFDVPATAMSASSRMITGKARRITGSSLVFSLLNLLIEPRQIGPLYGKTRNLCITSLHLATT